MSTLPPPPPGATPPPPPDATPPPPPGATPPPPPGATAQNSYQCLYCRQTSLISTETSCPRCGAPIDVSKSVSKSGWILLPGSKDLARIQFGKSEAQISGKAVPICDINLGPNESVMFYHSELLWLSGVTLSPTKTPAGLGSRLLGGLPRIMMMATGPGNIALSADGPGELIAVPLEQGQAIVVAQHHLLMVTDFISINVTDTGLFISEEQDNNTGDVVSRYLNVLTSTRGPGLVVLHAPGNVVIRDLAPNERILVQPTSVVYADSSVSRRLHIVAGSSARSLMGSSMRTIFATELVGPGRVALASVYEHVPYVPGNSSLYGGSMGSLRGGLSGPGGQIAGSLLNGLFN